MRCDNSAQTVYLDHVEETAAGQPVSSGFASSGYNIPEDKRDVIGFNCCRFSWDPFHNLTDDTKNTEDTREQFVLDLEGEVLFKRNQFNIVVGSTASGKVLYLLSDRRNTNLKHFIDLLAHGSSW